MFETNLALRARSFKLFLLLVFLITASAYQNPAFGQSTTTWTGGAGNWSNVNMWSPNPCAPSPPCYPNNQNPLWDVAIDGGNSQASPVTLDVYSIINNLTIDNDDSLGFNDGDSLWIYGTTINNAGQITVTSSSGGSGLIIGGANVSLTGGGTLTLAGGEISCTNCTQVLTNQETIQGAGTLNLIIINNQSLIDANGASPLHIDLGAATGTNSGTLEASGGGLLQFDGGAINNAGGTIQALDGSTVQLDNLTINNGTLTTAGSGIIHSFSNGPILNGVTNSGTYQVPDGSNTTLEGTVTNTGAVQLNSTGAYGVVLGMSGTVTLTGGGTVTLSDQARNSVNGTLVNQNNTISGSGTMGEGTLTNSGVINATSALHNHLLIFYSGDLVTNTGTLEASSGGTLDIETNVTNTGGTIQALAGTGTAAGGTVTLTGVTVTGGTLKTSGTGVNTGLIISTNSTFNGIANAGTLQVADNSTTFLEGTINNTGLIQLLSTSSGSNLRIIGNVTLSGSGKLTMLNNTFVWGASTGSEILTNQSTIQGAGNIGNGFMGLVNTGTILANQTTQLFIQPSSKAFNNTGKLSVAKGSILDITGGLFLNFSGTTLTGGTYPVTGTLQFDNANIVTNAANITLTGTSSQIIDQSSHNALASFATNAAKGSFTLAGNQNLKTSGGFSNAGTIKVSKGSTLTVGASGNYTQSGGKTTVDGTLTTSSTASFTGGSLFQIGAGSIQINGGSVFGNAGTLAATVTSSGTLNVGDLVKKAGLLSITGGYTQNAAGVLNIDIGGTTAGTQFDQLNISGAASLNGVLNLSVINAFVPAIGSTFAILNYSSRTGQFSTVNGTKINGSEHFTVSYNPTAVVLTVVAGAGGL